MTQITYTLVASMDDAKKLARTLVEEKLTACVNILPNILSIYEWKGELQESSEVALIVKSSPDAKERLIERIAELHPYKIPAILTLEAESTLEFEAWVMTVCKGKVFNG